MFLQKTIWFCFVSVWRQVFPGFCRASTEGRFRSRVTLSWSTLELMCALVGQLVAFLSCLVHSYIRTVVLVVEEGTCKRFFVHSFASRTKIIDGCVPQLRHGLAFGILFGTFPESAKCKIVSMEARISEHSSHYSARKHG